MSATFQNNLITECEKLVGNFREKQRGENPRYRRMFHFSYIDFGMIALISTRAKIKLHKKEVKL